jgi:hypothetical protein
VLVVVGVVRVFRTLITKHKYRKNWEKVNIKSGGVYYNNQNLKD